MTRTKEIQATDYTPDQQRVAQRISSALGNVGGPFAAWIRRPGVADGFFSVLTTLRDAGVLPARLRMIATLTVIRHWGAEYAWSVNKPPALKAGIPESVIEAIEQRRTPEFDNADDALAYEVAHELLNERRLSDASFERARAALGEDALTELIALIGYFSAVGLTVIAYDIKARTD